MPPRRTTSRAPVPSDPGLTIDELARVAGTTSRQVRALQTRGLLPHPRVVGRTGYYDAIHAETLRAVLRLQDHGFSLAAIATLVQAWRAGATLGEVLGLPEDAEPDDDDGFGWDALEPWARGGRPALSIVPTTVLAHQSSA